MADKIFFIERKPQQIFGVGFRPAIMGRAAEMGLKPAATNMPDKKNPRVQVLVSGSYDTITTFHNQIKNNDIRIKPTEKVGYRVTKIEEYSGPNIDWNGYQLSLMTEQMYKGFLQANQLLTTMNEQIAKVNEQICKGFSETNKRLEKGFTSITKNPPMVKSAKKVIARSRSR